MLENAIITNTSANDNTTADKDITPVHINTLMGVILDFFSVLGSHACSIAITLSRNYLDILLGLVYY